MSTRFLIPSSDPDLLEKATQVAETFAQTYIKPGIIGIAFLGAIARGYYDSNADIDIAFFKAPGADIPPPANYIHEQGLEIHSFLADYAQEVENPWEMAKRWAFSSHRMYYDPSGLISKLFEQKIPLQPEERKWLMIEGMTQSDWYMNTLPRLWIARGNLVSAQHMFDEGITYFFNALFGLNNQLVADVKWRYYCVEQLPRLPEQFHERIQEVFSLRAFTEADIERRRQAFLGMWQEILPQVEEEVGMPYQTFSEMV